MPLEIRTIDPSELEAWQRAMLRGFHVGREPSVESLESVRPHFDAGRAWAAFDDGRIVGTLRSIGSRLAVPGGGDPRVALLTQVTVAPTHRRRGLLTSMLGADLAASRELGEPLGYLVAAEYPIYGRFGYGPAADCVDLTIDASVARFHDTAHVELHPSDPEEFRALAPVAYERDWLQQPGFIDRPARTWNIISEIERPDPSAPFKSRVIALDTAGDVVGYVVYSVKDRWTEGRPDCTLIVDDLHGATPAVEAALWQFCCEVDWVNTVRAERRGTQEPVRWFLHDARHLGESARRDFVWLRLLDLAAALNARRYLTTGAVTIEVVDKLGFAGGTVTLDAGPDGVTCTPTRVGADLTLDVHDLGAAYLGGTGVVTLDAVGRIDEHRPGAVAMLDALLRWPVAPWCSTMF